MVDKTIPYNDLPLLPPAAELDTKDVWRAVASASEALAKLEGQTTSTLTNFSNSFLLTEYFTLPEAVASQEVEDVATTIEDAIKGEALPDSELTQAQRETKHYTRTLTAGYVSLGKQGFLATNDYVAIQSQLGLSEKGLRTRPGYKIANRTTGEVFYTPPEGQQRIRGLLKNFEDYFNSEDDYPDPLVRMAILHYQFEAIHPFPDGNGRTGRILMPLYLVARKKLTFPVLFLSAYILRNRSTYYSLLREVTYADNWIGWVLFILKGVTEQAESTTTALLRIHNARASAQKRMPAAIPVVRHESILDYLYTNPSFFQDQFVSELHVHRNTGRAYLEALVKAGMLAPYKHKQKRYYINVALLQVLARVT